MKIVFFVQDLTIGGVIRQIAVQADEFDRRGHDVSLVGLFGLDDGWKLLWQRPAVALLGPPQMRVVPSLIGAARKLRRHLRDENVEVLYAKQGNLARFIAWLATRRSSTTLVWGLRGAGRSYSLRKSWKQALPFYFCRAVSGSVPLLISNSDAARARRAANGFRCRRQLTIPNGFDTDTFQPDGKARARVRAEWDVAEEPLVGLVGRMDPLHKGHRIFLEAAALVVRRRPDARFVVVGDVPGKAKSELELLAAELGLTSRLRWAGLRGDMPAVYNALDVLCSASRWEGFSNVVGEAMACGIPCVVTDVGDSALIVANGGIVVPWGEAEQLGNALETMLLRRQEVRPSEIRSLITSRFSIERCLDATEAALTEARASS